ncbi:uncharacterized protein LOC62_05G007609 [Vanrija pseudolonga]|uniref:Uncharacterized protein n=1 Tax=Vanrija pseudolonga TaxID=143232 RepID=A0AAF1BK00_9TREE|nr:hypothetical protein LOC62_05G007609 [Vanrija pseudolonga]
MPPSLMSDSGSSTATTTPAASTPASVADSTSSKPGLSAWRAQRKSQRAEGIYAGTTPITTSRDVEAALGSIHAQDPAYAASVLSAYVDAKRAKGATRADISQKLHLLERRMPQFAPSSLVVRRQQGLRITPELEALAGVTEGEGEGEPRRDGRVRRLVGSREGDSEWIELDDNN